MISSDDRIPPDQDRLAGDPDGEWHQSHWAFIAIGGLRNLRGLVIPLAFLFVSQGLRGGGEGLVWYGIAAVAAVFSAGGSLVAWWNYRYRITDRDITLRSGIVSKNERVIPFERIQAVNINEAPLERIFGVVQMQVDTGAGGGAEIELRSLDAGTATRLRAQLLAGRERLRGQQASTATTPETGSATQEETGVVDEGQVVRRLGTKDLLVAGATSGRIGAAAAIAGALAQFGEELVPRRIWERVPWDGLVDAAQRVQVIGATILVLGLVAWMISIVATVLTYGGFEVRQAGPQLHLQYGVLDKRRVTIPVRRIQAIRVSETLMRQPFGYADISFELAGQGAESGDRGTLFPILPKREVHALLAVACPEFAIDLDALSLQQLPLRARRRYIVAASIGWVVLVAAAAAVAWRFLDIPAWWSLSAMGLTPFFAWFGYLRYRDAGWLVADRQFVMRWRGIARETAITQARRLQFRELKADPFQRRANLVTFRTAVASGGAGEGISLAHLDREVAEGLAQRLGRSRQAPPPVDAHAGTGRTV